MNNFKRNAFRNFIALLFTSLLFWSCSYNSTLIKSTEGERTATIYFYSNGDDLLESWQTNDHKIFLDGEEINWKSNYCVLTIPSGEHEIYIDYSGEKLLYSTETSFGSRTDAMGNRTFSSVKTNVYKPIKGRTRILKNFEPDKVYKIYGQSGMSLNNQDKNFYMYETDHKLDYKYLRIAGGIIFFGGIIYLLVN